MLSKKLVTWCNYLPDHKEPSPALARTAKMHLKKLRNHSEGAELSANHFYCNFAVDHLSIQIIRTYSVARYFVRSEVREINSGCNTALLIATYGADVSRLATSNVNKTACFQHHTVRRLSRENWDRNNSEICQPVARYIAEYKHDSPRNLYFELNHRPENTASCVAVDVQ